MSKVKSVLLSTLVGLAFCFAGCSGQNITGASESDQNSSKSARIYILDPTPINDTLSDIKLIENEWDLIHYDIEELRK